MTWMGYDEWEAPDGYVDVFQIWPVWEQEGSLIVFWIGRTLAERAQKIFSQRVQVDAAGQLTPGASVNLLAVLDEHLEDVRTGSWHIMNVQMLANGQYGVTAQWIEEGSG